MAMVTATTRRMASGVSPDAANTKPEKESETESNKPKPSKEAMSNATRVNEENELCDKVVKDDLMNLSLA
ncbi:hypothetical protein PI124_g11737 [Phytophthora idaei]|nr:hypothetical protein PI124_g11737 [Phytophthora idaei]